MTGNREEKEKRHELIADLISNNKISTQLRLVQLLEQHGMKVTQATVSRDMKEMGIYTNRDGGTKSHYAISETPEIANPGIQREQLKRVLKEWTFDIVVSSNLVIIKTSPGSAHVIASALDRSEQPEILATLAGDDTVFVVVEEKVKNPIAQSLGKELKNMAGLT